MFTVVGAPGLPADSGLAVVRAYHSVAVPCHGTDTAREVCCCPCAPPGDATVGKTALTAMFFSGGNAYPKNYVMVRHPRHLLGTLPQH